MTPKTERLVNLTVALLETRRPMTFEELKQRTGFYGQADRESARRMFERDKDDLRRLGVPVEVVDIAFGEDQGYRVERGAYELPDVDLTAEEVAALALAVHLTGGESDRLALTKLVARAPDPAPLTDDPRVRVGLLADPVDDVAEAVVTRTALRFTYRSAAGAVTDRRADPYAIVQRRGSWYLVARDHDRDAIRAFRLDRMQGRPTTVGPAGAFAPPGDLDLAAAVSGPELAAIEVDIAVDGTARWAVESRGGVETGETHDGRVVLRVPGIDASRDRPWLLGLWPGGRVVSPPELAAGVEEGLAAVRRAHEPSAVSEDGA